MTFRRAHLTDRAAARRYHLAPANDEFLRTARIRTCRTIDVDIAAQELWSFLTADDAVVSWSRLVTRAQWTTTPPRGVGATREVTLGGLVTVWERFFRWEEGQRKTFSATAASVPGLRRFAEDYTVTEIPAGSRLTWTVALELTRTNAAAASIARAVLDVGIRSMLHGLQRRTRSAARPSS